MKKVISFFVMAGICAMSFAQQAIIREINGTVEIKTPLSAAWVPAEVGTELSKDTLISTGFKSTALLSLGNSTLAVRPLTRLSLDELTVLQGDEKVSLNLQAGRVRVEVVPPAARKTNFTVKSPSATASVRGTVFEFDVTNLKVNKGIVRYSGARGRPVIVNAGAASFVDVNSGRTASPSGIAAANLNPTLPLGSESGVPLSNAFGVTVPASVPGTGSSDTGGSNTGGESGQSGDLPININW